jgi:CBS domain-containing protein
MTRLVATCAKADSADDVSMLMTEHRARHIPVLENGRLAGIVSIGDVVKSRMEELQAEHAQLRSYISQG